MIILFEIQTDNGSTAILPAATYTDRNAADSAYHTKLASAAISSVDVHTVLMIDEHGNTLRREYYEHLDAE